MVSGEKFPQAETKKSPKINTEGTSMEDCKIVDMYWDRDECAIAESDKKYGRMLNSLSFSLLSSREDAEECVNDTYIDAWNSMPTARPDNLGAFLSKITRRISIDRHRQKHRQKRGGVDNLVLELTDCIPSGESIDDELESKRLGEALDSFLYSLDKEKRVMFVRRYFYSHSIEQISAGMGISESKVKTTLFRVRKALRDELEREGLL